MLTIGTQCIGGTTKTLPADDFRLRRVSPCREVWRGDLGAPRTEEESPSNNLLLDHRPARKTVVLARCQNQDATHRPRTPGTAATAAPRVHQAPCARAALSHRSLSPRPSGPGFRARRPGQGAHKGRRVQREPACGATDQRRPGHGARGAFQADSPRADGVALDEPPLSCALATACYVPRAFQSRSITACSCGPLTSCTSGACASGGGRGTKPAVSAQIAGTARLG